MPSGYETYGQKRVDEEKAKDANERVKALDSEVIQPGEGLGLAARMAKIKAEKEKAGKATPTPTPAPKKKKKLSGEEQQKALLGS